jgi:hypothetical protein
LLAVGQCDDYSVYQHTLNFKTGKRNPKLMRRLRSWVILFVMLGILFAPRLGAQSTSTSTASLADSSRTDSSPSPASNSAKVIPAGDFMNHYLWTEKFSGSTNSQGQVLSLDSIVGYVFSNHFGVNAGIPIYFVHGTSTTSTGGTTSTSNAGLGDAYLQLRFAFPNPLLNYKVVLTGAVPTGNTATGLSTGHATYDWTNHFDHRFGRWTLFAEAGFGNSIPANFIFNRPYESFGHEAHFQAGAGYQVADWVSVGASAYDIVPWGTQTIFSRTVGKSSAPTGKGGSGPVFGLANQTTGSSGLAADNGFSADADFSPGSVLDFSLRYSHSVHFQLDTFSFGIGVNMSQLLRRSHAGL